MKNTVIGLHPVVVSSLILYNILQYWAFNHPDIIINREVFKIAFSTTFILGVISMMSTVFVKNMDSNASWCLSLVAVIFAVLLIGSTLLAFIIQFVFFSQTLQGPFEFTLSKDNVTIRAQRFGSQPNFSHYEILKSCHEDTLGCLIVNETHLEQVYVLVDNKPSSPLPSFTDGKTVILIRNGTAHNSTVNKNMEKLEKLLKIGKSLQCPRLNGPQFYNRPYKRPFIFNSQRRDEQMLAV